jgi:hypothetical protein
VTEHPQDPVAPEPEPAGGDGAAGGWVPEGEGVKAIPDAWVISSGEGDWAPPGDSPAEAVPGPGEDPAPLVPDSELATPPPEPTVPEPEPTVPEPEPVAPAAPERPAAGQSYTAPPPLPPSQPASGGSGSIVTDRPEIIIAAAFVGGFLLATLIKRLAR